MPFTDDELAEHMQVLEEHFWSRRRPPLHLRDRIREGQRIDGYSIELFHSRPDFLKPGEYADHGFVKLRYVRSRNLWRIFWMKADLKWHGYWPYPEAKTLAEALAVVDEDANCCFFG